MPCLSDALSVSDAERVLCQLVDLICPGLDSGDVVADAQQAIAALAGRGTLAPRSAPEYVELAWSRQSGWRAWILDGPGPREAGHVVATGAGDTPDEACACAVLQWKQASQASGESERATCTGCGCVGQGACSESDGGCFTAGAGSDAACDDDPPWADPLAAHAGEGVGAGWGSWRQRA